MAGDDLAGSAVEAGFEPGVVVDGRYRIEEEIGRGAMGVVFRVHDRSLSCDRALKVLRADQIDNEDTVRRFREEGRSAVRAAGDLAHPNIVTVYDAGEFASRPYMVMELFKGVPLDAIMSEEERLPSHQVARIGVQLAEALASAHQHGVVHRDVKPANIMMSVDRSTAKLTDFSVARVKTGDEHAATRTGVVIGAPRYMSPEQALAKSVDGRSDLYGLGVVLYELLTGRKAFRSDTITALLIEITQTDPEPVRKTTPDVSPGLEHIVMKLLEKDPDRRFQSGLELAAALRRELKNMTDRDLRASSGLPTEIKAAGLLAAIVAALMTVGGGLLYNQQTNASLMRTAEAGATFGEILSQRIRRDTLDALGGGDDPRNTQITYQADLPEIVAKTASLDYIRVVTADDRIWAASAAGEKPPAPKHIRDIDADLLDAEARIIETPAGVRNVAVTIPFALWERTEDGDQQTDASLVVGLATTQIRDAARLTLSLLALLGVLTTGSVGLLSYLATRRFARPMGWLRDGLNDLAAGDSDVRLSGGSGLVAETFAAFNAAAAARSAPAPAGDDPFSSVADAAAAASDEPPPSAELAVEAAGAAEDVADDADDAGSAGPEETEKAESGFVSDPDKTAVFMPGGPSKSS